MKNNMNIFNKNDFSDLKFRTDRMKDLQIQKLREENQKLKNKIAIIGYISMFK